MTDSGAVIGTRASRSSAKTDDRRTRSPGTLLVASTVSPTPDGVSTTSRLASPSRAGSVISEE